MDTEHRCLRVAPGSPSWPADLDTIQAPPDQLWLAGRLELLAIPRRIAIVGSRAPTPYGEAQAARFAEAFARLGITVVSGLARGVDQAAHAAALESGGATIAVLACGVDRPWPAGELTRRIGREGLFVSELLPGQPPRPHQFPLRNRLISGLSAAVVVVEAAHASGSLITARWAADQGREVFALPGRVDHPMSRGCHRLIREGAQLAEDPADVLEDLGWGGAPSFRDLLDLAEPSPRPAAPPGAEAVLGALQGETLGAEALARRTGEALPRVLVTLVELEMQGSVHRLPGGLYRLARRPG